MGGMTFKMTFISKSQPLPGYTLIHDGRTEQVVYNRRKRVFLVRDITGSVTGAGITLVQAIRNARKS